MFCLIGHIQQTLVHAGFEDIINIPKERYCPVANRRAGITRDGCPD